MKVRARFQDLARGIRDSQSRKRFLRSRSVRDLFTDIETHFSVIGVVVKKLCVRHRHINTHSQNVKFDPKITLYPKIPLWRASKAHTQQQPNKKVYLIINSHLRLIMARCASIISSLFPIPITPSFRFPSFCFDVVLKLANVLTPNLPNYIQTPLLTPKNHPNSQSQQLANPTHAS